MWIGLGSILTQYNKMYEPREDSFLLQKHIKKYARGFVLDIGTGSGILALEAAKSKKTTKIFAVDIDQEAIDYCSKNIDNKKIIFLVSDLFSFFKKLKSINEDMLLKKHNLKIGKEIKFDTILFNPPYLPGNKYPDLESPKGYELIQRFFKDAKEFLKPKGKILIVFSSLTNKPKINQIIEKNRFRFKELEKQHISFEDIYVYLVTNNKI